MRDYDGRELGPGEFPAKPADERPVPFTDVELRWILASVATAAFLAGGLVGGILW